METKELKAMVKASVTTPIEYPDWVEAILDEVCETAIRCNPTASDEV